MHTSFSLSLRLLRRGAVLLALSSVGLIGSACAQVSVLSERYGNSRTGANLSESHLNTSNVNASSFGKLWTYNVSGSVYAQPLYVPNISIAGGTHNVLYVATMNDVVYAFDADSSAQLWSINLASQVSGTPVSISDIVGPGGNIVGNVGIESTPVIDPNTRTMYLVTRTKESGNFVQRLHALDITSGAEKFGGSVIIRGSVPGNGDGSVNGVLTFDPRIHNQRTSLALANGQVYIGWASHEDQNQYHGWIMSYSASTLAQTGIMADTAQGYQGGIWMGGWAPSVDASGNVYYSTGNGTWDGNHELSESILRFGPSSLQVQDWFTPSNWSSLNGSDADLGSSGPMLIPGTDLVVVGGKRSTFYVTHTGNLGHEQTGDGQIVQVLNNNGGEIKGGPVYWNRSGGAGPWMYVWSDGDYLKAYHYNGSRFDSSPVSQSTFTSQGGSSGGVLTLSANGSAAGSGIVWASMPLNTDGDHGVVLGVLRAMNADDLTHELWNSQQNAARDAAGYWPKFSPPTVANGRVYMASFPSDGTGTGHISTYGLLNSSTSVSAPSFSPGGGSYSSSQSVTISTATAGASIHYTTDGSTPSSTSNTYTGAISIGSTTTLKAVAVLNGNLSPVTSATYTISTTVGTVATPAFSPGGGSYSSAQTVSISDSTSGAVIHYTKDGSTPTSASPTYSGAITVSANTTLKAMATASGMNNSAVATATYTIGSSGSGTVATPSFSPGGGGYSNAQTVTISDATSGAVIHYTTDGSTPTTASKTYSGPLTISTSTTLKAMATASGQNNSAVLTATYTIFGSSTVATPQVSPGGASYTSTQSVTLTDATSGAVIHYTTDGSTPTASSAIYSGALTISSTTTLKAMATASGKTNSAVLSATYTIGSTAGGSIPRQGWNVVYVDSQETGAGSFIGANTIDGNASTYWHTAWSNSVPGPPHEIRISLGQSHSIAGFTYLPRQDGCTNGTILKYEFYVSSDGVNWGTPVSAGTFNYGSNFVYSCGGGSVVPARVITFPAVTASYVRLRALSEYGGNPWTSMAELNLLQGGTTTSGTVVPASIVVSPSTVLSGAGVTGTVTLSGAAPSGGTVVSLSSSSTAASVPATVTVAAGQMNKTFTIGTVSGTSATATISAAANGTAVHTSLNIASYVSQSAWTLKYVDSQELSAEDGRAINVFDGNTTSKWHSEWSVAQPAQPHEIQIDTGSSQTLRGFRYLPRQDGCSNGTIAQYEFYVSSDGSNWGSPVSAGTFKYGTTTFVCPGQAALPAQVIGFPPTTGRYIRLRSLSEVNGHAWTSGAELQVLR